MGDRGSENDVSRSPQRLSEALAARSALVFVAVLSLIILVLALIPGSRELLRLEPAALLVPAEGARWFGAHLVHLGWRHVLLNLAGLWLVAWYLGARFGAGSWALSAAIAAIAVDIGIGLWNPELGWYVGLSGVLHGVLIAGLVEGAGLPRWERSLMGAVIAAKIGWEQVAGPVPGSEQVSGGPVLVDAHLYGALGGLVAGLLLLALARRRG
jgi:rhomboid family GlyGly-CTERM serine protease